MKTPTGYGQTADEIAALINKTANGVLNEKSIATQVRQYARRRCRYLMEDWGMDKDMQKAYMPEML